MNKKIRNCGKCQLRMLTLSLGLLGGASLYASTPERAEQLNSFAIGTRVNIFRHREDEWCVQWWQNSDTKARIELWNALTWSDRGRLEKSNAVTNGDRVQLFRNLASEDPNVFVGFYLRIPEGDRQEFLASLDPEELIRLFWFLGNSGLVRLVDDFCVQGQLSLRDALNNLGKQKFGELFHNVSRYAQGKILQLVNHEQRVFLEESLSFSAEQEIVRVYQADRGDPPLRGVRARKKTADKTADMNDRTKLWAGLPWFDRETLVESEVVDMEVLLRIFRSLYLVRVEDLEAKRFLSLLSNCGKLDEFFCCLENEERIRILQSGVFVTFESLLKGLGSRGREILQNYRDEGVEMKFESDL